MSNFINDCVARALLTLPWANVDENDRTLRDICDDVRSGAPARVASALMRFYELVDVECATHEAVGNYIKAGILAQFRTELGDFFHAPADHMKWVKNVAPTIDTSPYRRSHGAEPRGRGSWAFVFGNRADNGPTAALANRLVDETPADECWWAIGNSDDGPLTFAAAKKMALREAKARGATLVAVCP